MKCGGLDTMISIVCFRTSGLLSTPQMDHGILSIKCGESTNLGIRNQKHIYYVGSSKWIRWSWYVAKFSGRKHKRWWAKKFHHAIKRHDNTVRRLYCRLTVESVSFARWLVVRPPPMSHLLSQILPRDALQKRGSTYLTSTLGQKRKVLSKQTLNINWLTGE